MMVYLILLALQLAPEQIKTGSYSFFDLNSEPGFQLTESAFKELARKKQHYGHSTFCAIGYRYSERDMWGLVYWEEERALILWEGWSDTSTPDLTFTRRYWNLDTDIAEDSQGSTYLLTPSWVSEKLLECWIYGHTYTIDL